MCPTRIQFPMYIRLTINISGTNIDTSYGRNIIYFGWCVLSVQVHTPPLCCTWHAWLQLHETHSLPANYYTTDYIQQFDQISLILQLKDFIFLALKFNWHDWPFFFKLFHNIKELGESQIIVPYANRSNGFKEKIIWGLERSFISKN